MRNLCVNLTSPEFEDHVSCHLYAQYFSLNAFLIIYSISFHDVSINPKTFVVYINYGDFNFEFWKQTAGCSHSLYKECPVFLSYGALLYGLNLVVANKYIYDVYALYNL